MSKKLIIFLIAGVVIIGLIGFVAFRLLTAEPGERGLLDILPFGRSPDAGPTTPGDSATPGTRPGGSFGSGALGSTTPATGNLSIDEPLVVVSKTPVAGLFAFARGEKKASTTPLVRFVEQATGHIYEADLHAGTVARLTNTTIPKIHEAYFTEKGEGVIMRYLREEGDDIQTWYGKITPPDKKATTTEQKIATLEGGFLPAGVSALAVSPATDRIFYILPGTGEVQGVVSAPNGSGRRELITLDAREWLVAWPATGSAILTTKPSSEALGYTYELALASGVLHPLLGDVRGLTALVNPGITTALVGSSGANGMTLAAQALNQKPASAPLPTSTLPEKCVWSKREPTKAYCAVPKTLPTAAYPDAWYQGRVAFSDAVWLFDTDQAGGHSFITDLEALAGTRVDATHLRLDPEERYLYLVDKNNGSLVAVRLGESLSQ